MLGGLGHHVNAPAGVTAVAMGQRVVLPPGTTLTFVLSQAPAAGPAPAPPSAVAPSVAPAPQPAQPSAAPVAAPGQDWWMCQYKDVKDRLKPELGYIRYYALFPSSETLAGGPHGMDVHFNAYVPQNYKINDINKAGGYCERISNDVAGREYSKNLLLQQWTSSNDQPVHVAWTDTPAENAAIEAKTVSGNAAVVAAGPVLGPNQTYGLCFSDMSAPVVYLTDIFPVPLLSAADVRGNGGGQRAAAAAAAAPFQAFLQKKYGSNNGVSCAISFLPTAAGLRSAQDRMQTMRDMAKQNKAEVVETGWKQ
jgi:hypothetical protein